MRRKVVAEVVEMFVVTVLSSLGLFGKAHAEAGSPSITTYQGEFATAGIARQKNRGIGSGISGGMGFRTKYLGMKFCVIDRAEFDDSRISILPAFFHQAPLVDLGKKQTGTSFGYDLDGYINLGETISLYAGPGIYFAGVQDIQLEKYADGKFSHSAFAGPKREKFVPAAEGGLQLNIPFSSKSAGRVLLGIGYHSIRGITCDLGLRY